MAGRIATAEILSITASYTDPLIGHGNDTPYWVIYKRPYWRDRRDRWFTWAKDELDAATRFQKWWAAGRFYP